MLLFHCVNICCPANTLSVCKDIETHASKRSFEKSHLNVISIRTMGFHAACDCSDCSLSGFDVNGLKINRCLGSLNAASLTCLQVHSTRPWRPLALQTQSLLSLLKSSPAPSQVTPGCIALPPCCLHTHARTHAVTHRHKYNNDCSYFLPVLSLHSC